MLSGLAQQSSVSVIPALDDGLHGSDMAEVSGAWPSWQLQGTGSMLSANYRTNYCAYLSLQASNRLSGAVTGAHSSRIGTNENAAAFFLNQSFYLEFGLQQHSSCSLLWSKVSLVYTWAQVMRDSGIEVPLVSSHSVSKGFYGECGRRGASMELVGFPKEVLGQLGKLASISLCSNIAGQIAMAIVMNPPKVLLLLIA